MYVQQQGVAFIPALKNREFPLLFLNLYNANPNNVFILSGNHDVPETIKLENANKEEKDLLARFLKHLPAALFLGYTDKENTNYLQFCHGGLEVGYNPYPFLNSNKQFENILTLNRKHFFEKFAPQLGTSPVWAGESREEIKKKFHAYIDKDNLAITEPFLTLGMHFTFFLSDDFPYSHDGYFTTDRFCHVLSHEQTEYLLDPKTWDSKGTAKIIAIYRGHEHVDNEPIKNMMLKKLKACKGYLPQWDGLLNTIVTSPNCNGGYETFVTLHLAPNYKERMLEITATPVEKN